jgi:hypothetical protein
VEPVDLIAIDGTRDDVLDFDRRIHPGAIQATSVHGLVHHVLARLGAHGVIDRLDELVRDRAAVLSFLREREAPPPVMLPPFTATFSSFAAPTLRPRDAREGCTARRAARVSKM